MAQVSWAVKVSLGGYQVGVYFELEGNGCQVGGLIHNQFWNKFPQEQQNQIALDNLITVEGILTRNDGRLLVSGQKLVGIP